MPRRLHQAVRGQRGYTIVELIVAMSIFAVVMVIAVGAFVTVQGTSNKTTAQRKVQQDSRYNLELLARQIRAGRIDYGFYARNASDARCNVTNRQMLALFVAETAANGSSDPVVTRVFYFTADDPTTSVTTDTTLYSLADANVSSTPTCDEVINNPARVKQIGSDPNDPNRVVLTNLQFFILPTRDPLNTAETSAVIQNTHPRVTVLWTAQSGNPTGNSTDRSKFNQDRLEMTISTRSYPLNQTVGQ